MNPKFIDVDFTQDPNFCGGYNGPGDLSRFARYEDEMPVYPESSWVEMAAADNAADDLVTRIFDQKQEGSCVANASSQGMEVAQARQFGKDRVVHLSAISLYKRIGSSPSSGANVSDAWDALAADGVLPLDDDENKKRFKHTMPNTGFSTPYPDGWKETAKMFKGLEVYKIDSLPELVAAMLDRFGAVVGRSGHSIFHAKLVNKDGDLFARYANSWKESWGEKGFGYDSMSMMKQACHGAYAIRSIIVPAFQDLT